MTILAGASRLAFAAWFASAPRALASAFSGAIACTRMTRLFGFILDRRCGGLGVAFGTALDAWNGLTDQLLDGGDRLVVQRRDDGDRGSGPAGAAGAADTMDIIVRMMRHVEIENVAD